MIDTTDNLVLEHLRHIRGGVDKSVEDMDDLRSRMSSLEASMVSVRRDVNHGDDVDARQQSSLDRLAKRVDRLEQRLELTDAP